MPRKALVGIAVAAGLVVFELVGSHAVAAERWRRPLPGGAVVGAFSFERAAPYQRGRRRGVDFVGRPGAPVLAPCSGTVTYVGAIPARRGKAITIRCGDLVATELGLSTTSRTRGARIARGTRVGTLGARPLRLGARLASDRHGYLDPLTLIRDDGGNTDSPRVAPPVAISPRALPRRIRPSTAPRLRPAEHASPARLPWPAVAGLALIASATAGGATMRVRRGRRTRQAVVLFPR